MAFSLFDLDHTLALPLFARVSRPWEVLALLTDFIHDLGPRLGPDFDQVAEGIWVGKGTLVDPFAALRGPAIVGRDSDLRPGAFLRAGVLAGDGCVLGNSSEFKNCILFDGVEVPHFSYVGDSVLGFRVHFGAGAITSNFRADHGEVSVDWDGIRTRSGLSKLGVLAGDRAEVGAQTVLNPGTILGRKCRLYPLASVRGTVPPETIVKSSDPETWVPIRQEPVQKWGLPLVSPGPPEIASPDLADPRKVSADYLLVASQTVLMDFITALSGLVAVLNPERQIIFASPDFLDLLGQPAVASLLGKRPGEALDCIHVADRPGGCGTSESCSVCGAVRAIEKSRETRLKVTEECRLTVHRPGGPGTLDLEVTSTPWSLDGRPFTVLTVKDIGPDKRKNALERIFFHDILNSAGGLAGLLSILDDYPDLNEGKELVGMSRRSSQDILEEILSFQQLKGAETGDLTVENMAVDPVQLVREVADKIRFHPVAEGKILETDAESAPTALVTDRLLVGRVLVNMLKNALEAVKPGAVVRVGCRVEGSEAVFWVRNPGTIDPRVQLQVFQRSFSTKSPDRGLGTYSMKLIGEKYLRGQVSFLSDGAGTEFRLKLPGAC